ncbi:hypothetical protein C2G38_2168602 [Gigaspora rosea]|uniref:Uncharacterized protein n=1 Tax=Gigaspora rosea TaxID=44941 RepID=A0A397VPQ1_9GLOM|nr:hypothetical protein C2G38_2168602 [Gigaspora rosea]
MPRKDHYKKSQKQLNMKLCSEDKNVNEIIRIVKKLIKERKSFISRQLNKNEITTKNYELENSELKKLENQIDSLKSKEAKRLEKLENNKILYETENNELKEKLNRITNLYEDNKSDLERYYNVIQRTYSILQEVFSSNKIDTIQLAGLCNEIKEVCEGSEVESNITTENSPDGIVLNSFEDALLESEPKIEEINAEQSFPTLVCYQRFYAQTNDQENKNANNT